MVGFFFDSSHAGFFLSSYIFTFLEHVIGAKKEARQQQLNNSSSTVHCTKLESCHCI